MTRGSWLKPYSRIKSCPKCNGNISIKYYDGEHQLLEVEMYGGLKGSGLNYLIHTCDTCGYNWRTKTKDNKK